MKLRIDNNAFFRSHGKQPSGEGYWAFELRSGKSVQIVFCPGLRTLGFAKKWLSAWVTENMNAELQSGRLSASVAP